MLRFSTVLILTLAATSAAFGQSYMELMLRDSARSDKLTGGLVKGSPSAGEPDVKITINVPAFQLTLWQNGKEVKTYPIGVGKVEYPLIIGRREATRIEWNPVWIPPSSDWIERSSTVKPGEIVLPTDPRNPLGKVKIPLGYGYLIHQAKGRQDLGSLVSHGCVRVIQADLYDLAEKIIAARELPVKPEQIAAAKRSKRTLTVTMEDPLAVDITYDTLVVESGRLHIYPDVYNHKRNTVQNLRQELRTSGVEDSRLTDAAIRKMLSLAKGRNQFVVAVSDIEAGNALLKGRLVPVVSALFQRKGPTT